MGNDKETILKNVQLALEEIRPYLQADGGDIDLVDITDNMVVRVKLQGSCQGCPMSLQTLKGGVEMVVKKAVPQIVEVVAVD